MLVLTRRIGEEIVIPDLDIRIKVIRRDGKSVRLGISAPDDVRIQRSEVCDQPVIPPRGTQGDPRITSSAAAGM